jgi:hypothetical protein
MKSLSQFLTESIMNESVQGVKSWAGSSFCSDPKAAEKISGLKKIAKNINSYASDLSKKSNLSKQDAVAATLSFANFIVNNIKSSALSNDIEEFMEIVNFKYEDGDPWLNAIYSSISEDTNGKIDPMSELE